MYPASSRILLISLLIAGGLSVCFWIHQSSWSACVREVQMDDYLAASKSCGRAKATGWPFQALKPVQYAEVLSNFGLSRLELQDYPSAKRELEESANRLKSLLPNGARGYAVVLSNLGLLSQREGNFKSQEYWYRQSTSAFDEFRLYCDRSAATAGSNLASALSSLGRLDEAEAALRTRVARNDDCPNLPPYVRGSTLRRLGEIQTGQGEEEAALAAFERAMSLLRQAQGESSLEMAYTLISRATALRRLDRFSEAERDVGLALPMLTRWVGVDAPEVGTVHSVLANSLRVQRKYVQALEEYKQADRIYRARLGPNHPWLASLQLQMGRTYRALGDNTQATKAFKDAERIRIATFGAGSPQVLRVREELDEDEQS